MIDSAAHARLEPWKQSLLDLSAANPLLDAQDGPTTIPLPDVDVARIAEALAAGAAFALESGPAAPLDLVVGASGTTGRLRSSLAKQPLAQRLTGLRRAGAAQLADRGAHALWLGLGMLTWCETAPDVAALRDEPVRRCAPVALWPVALVRAGATVRLVGVAGIAPRCNPALVEKLRRDAGVSLPAGDSLDLAALLDAAQAVAEARPGWQLDRAALLGLFAVAPISMWQDLEARGDELLRNPVIAHLARGGGQSFSQPSPEAARALAGGAPTSDLVAPLEADASQLAAIAAAAAGASFVLQGAPGTGKSQTIANLIVHAMASGKSVLFASAKRAALDVVQRRLAELGLGELCLALHGEHAARGAVIAQLGRVIERVFRPAAARSADAVRLGDLVAALDGHVAALHRVGPFGRSLHEVLGRLIDLRATPSAALAERDATGLDRVTYERRLRAVEQLATAAALVEPISGHAWRDSVMERWPADGRDRARAALDEAAAAAAGLAEAIQGVAALVPGLVARTRDQLQALGALAALAAASPRPGAERLTQLRIARGDDILERIALIRARGTGAIDAPRDPATFLALASRHRMLATEVNDRFTDAVGELDAAELWGQLRRWANSVAPLRFVALRQARAAVRAAAMPGMLETDGAMVTALESVIAERAVRAALVAAAEPAKRWFGELGSDPLALDLARIDAAVAWAAELRRAFEAVDVERGDTGRAATWRALVAQVAANPPAESPGGGGFAAFAALAAAAARWQPALAALADATGIDAVTLGAGDDHLAALGARIASLRGALGAMRDWVAFHAARRGALAAGVGAAVGSIERGELAAGELAEAWERATLVAWANAELDDTPLLAQFQGAAHHAHAAAFAERDRTALGLVRSQALVRFAERVPRIAAGAAVSDADAGEIAVLLHELKDPSAASRAAGSVRDLLAALPTLLPRLAPCLAVSPAAAAELLDPSLRFDLVVIDEASQLPAAEAIGVLARGDAAIVVGDAQQLPPAGWFVAALTAAPGSADLTGPISLDDPDGEVGSGERSILDVCLAARLPELRLTSHYRSKHEDLFAFANQRYYGDRLQLLPAAHATSELGMVWRRVDGVFDRTGTRQNLVEAEAVVVDVIARLRDPAQRGRSLAVVTLSRAQQALIEDLLDAARGGDPELDALFDPAAQPAGEPIVVKTIDAIQGDERDVVLMSIGYGPDPDGVFITHLGPLSQPGGEQRLNVAITRAREQLVFYASFASEDLAAAGGQGVHDLAMLLALVRDGGSARAARVGASEAPPASPITAAIARALGERGWIVHHQVGYGRYKLDLAVVDPNDPERYVLAIEHDGAAYASAPQARDRDRLRPQLLGQLGWRVHRIWTLDWWTDPERELQRAHGAIITAVAANRQRKAHSAPVRAPLRASGDADRPRYVSPRLGSAPTGRAASGTTPPPARAGARPTQAPLLRVDAEGSGGAPSQPSTPSDTAPTGARPRGEPGGAAASTADAVASGSGPNDAIAALLGEPGELATGEPGAATGESRAGGTAPIRIAKNTIAIGPYLAAAIPAGRRAPDDLFAPRHLGQLGKIIDQVLAAEAPMHVEVLARRVGAYFGIGRLTPRVIDQVRVALAGRGRWGDENDIVWRIDQDPAGVPAVRVAGQAASARRAIEEVPLAEVAAAARIVVERATLIGANDLVRDTSRLLGFARVTERVIQRVASGVKLARQRQLIRIESGKAMLPD